MNSSEKMTAEAALEALQGHFQGCRVEIDINLRDGKIRYTACVWRTTGSLVCVTVSHETAIQAVMDCMKEHPDWKPVDDRVERINALRDELQRLEEEARIV